MNHDQATVMQIQFEQRERTEIERGERVRI